MQFAINLGLYCRRTLLWIVVAAVIVLGALAAVARYALPPLVERWEPEIEQILSQQLRRSIEIGELDLAWRDYGLALSVSELEVPEQKQRGGHLNVGRAFVRLDPWSSLWKGHPVFDGLLLEELRVNVDLDENEGQFWGAPGGAIWAPGTVHESEPIFSIQSIDLVDAEIVVQGGGFGDQPQRFPDLDLSLRRAGDGYRFGINAALPAAFGERLVAIGQISGNMQRPQQWQGEFYAEADALNLAVLRRVYPKLDVIDGHGQVRLWVDWAAGRVQRADVALALTDVAAKWGESVSKADGVEGRLLWLAEDQGWTLRGDRLRIAHQGHESLVPGFALRVLRASDGRLREVRGEIGRVAATTLGHIAKALPQTPNAVVDYVESSRPRGDIDDLHFRWQPGAVGEELALSLRARFEGIGVQPVAGFPGIGGLSGDLIVYGEKAWIDVEGREVALDAPRLFEDPLVIDSLRGRMFVSREEAGWQLRTHRLEAVNDHLSTVSRLHLQIGAGWHSPSVDLQTAFYRVDASRYAEFLPLRVLRPRLVQWLSRAIVKGDVPAGAVLFRGSLAAFPFRDSEGAFLAEFAVHDGILEFDRRWPRAEELDVDVVFRGNSFRAEAESGKILGLQTDKIRAEIASLGEPVVHLSTGGESELPALLEFLQATPLAERVGSRLGPLVFAGEAGVTVDLELPLKNPSARVKGTIEFRDSEISIPPWRLELAAVNGTVGFTEASVQSEALTAELRGQALRVAISTERSAGSKLSTTVVEASGRMSAGDALQDYLAWLAPHVDGDSDWRARVRLGPEPGRVVVRLSSQLAGTAVELPAPVGKDADETVPVVLALGSVGQPGVLAMRLDYGLNLRFAGRLRPSTPGNPLLRGVLHFGSEDLEAVTEPGLRIAGTIDRFPIDEWFALSPKNGAGDLPPWLNSVDLRLDSASYGKFSLESVAVEARPGRWKLVSDSPRHRGYATGGFPVRAQPVAIRLETLSIEPAGIEPSEQDWVDPRSLPPLQFHADSLLVEGRPVGTLAFRSETTADGLTVPGLRSQSDNHTLDAALTWQRGPDGDRSVVQLTLDAKDTGAALRDFGIYSDVDGAEGRVEFSGEWQGPLPSFDQKSISGSLSAELGPGHLIEVRPGVGRLMGMFNLYDVGRRLQLDFREMGTEGFVFDSISAQGRLEAGNLYDDRIQVEGPAATIEISGRVGLIDRDYDQRILVTPKVSSTLSVAGLIAGGPAVGAAMLIAGKVFEDNINRAARVEYSLTGSWDEPVFEMVEVEGLDLNDPSSKGGDQ